MAFTMQLKAAPSAAQAAVPVSRQCSSRILLPPHWAAPAQWHGHATPCPVTQPVSRRSSVCGVVVKSGGLHARDRADDEIQEVLYTTEQLNEVLDEMGRQIGADYEGKDLLVLGVLKGGFVFTADLVRHIYPVPNSLEVDFFKASSYGSSTKSSGEVKLDGGFNLASVKDKHVLVAEDIIDSGLTMSKIVRVLRGAEAMSVRVAVLLDKRTRRQVTFDADYVGIVCPDEFVVGYGIDFAERYRWLPYIGVPKPEVVEAILAKKKQESEAAKKQLGDSAPQGKGVSSDAVGPIKPAASGNGSSKQPNGLQGAAPASNGVVGFKGFGNHIGDANNNGSTALRSLVGSSKQ